MLKIVVRVKATSLVVRHLNRGQEEETEAAHAAVFRPASSSSATRTSANTLAQFSIPWLAKYPHVVRIPWRLGPTLKPSPASVKAVEQPHRLAERARQMADGGVDADDRSSASISAAVSAKSPSSPVQARPHRRPTLKPGAE
jgi:hypothetical protein